MFDFVGVVLFKAMYLGGYDSLKHSLDLEKAHVTTKLLVAQVKQILSH